MKSKLEQESSPLRVRAARLRELMVVIIPMGFLGVLLFGFFMDKIVRAG
jgi:hypothetical protein